MKDVYTKFGLEAGTQDFVGHAMALWLDDEYASPFLYRIFGLNVYSYITKPARATVDRIILYTQSMARYGKSPYIYPLYGLGELPQAFARLSAIYGGTYMLDKQIESINVGDDGKFIGVTSGGETVKAKKVIGDPSYFGAGKELGEGGGQVRVIEIGKVVRAICILKHPIPGTDESDSAQIIIPQNQVGRKNGKSLRGNTKITTDASRHLHCRSVGFAQCRRERRLDRHGLDNRRDVCSRARNPARSATPRQCRRQVSCPFACISRSRRVKADLQVRLHHPSLRPNIRREERQCVYHQILRCDIAFRDGR